MCVVLDQGDLVATKLDAFPSRSQAGQLPLSEWLDGGVWELQADVDFSTSIASVRATLRAAAKCQGLKLRTRVTRLEGVEKLVIQAHGAAVNAGTGDAGVARSLARTTSARK
jgi:hypothetical protein